MTRSFRRGSWGFRSGTEGTGDRGQIGGFGVVVGLAGALRAGSPHPPRPPFSRQQEKGGELSSLKHHRLSPARMAPRESAKADFGPLLPRIHSPGRMLGR